MRLQMPEPFHHNRTRSQWRSPRPATTRPLKFRRQGTIRPSRRFRSGWRAQDNRATALGSDLEAALGRPQETAADPHGGTRFPGRLSGHAGRVARQGMPIP
jgi:hypothetical protein